MKCFNGTCGGDKNDGWDCPQSEGCMDFIPEPEQSAAAPVEDLHLLVRQIAPDERKAWGELWEAKFAFTESQNEADAQRFVDAAKDYAELVSKLTQPNKRV